MASSTTICQKVLGVKNTVIEGQEFYDDENGNQHLRIRVRPDKRHANECPVCHKACPRYDTVTHSKVWRDLDWNGTLVELESDTHRICCQEHGIHVADVPWAFERSSFTKSFDLTVGWLAVYLPRSVISEYMRIDWKTVGRCVSRTLSMIEPDRTKRLNGLVHIGIDETSYKKGHSYITVIVNHDTNTVVWAAPRNGKAVLEQFYRSLTPEQLASIKVVTGDGARWITDCVNEFTPDCERCVDPFHVVEWAMEALDEVRKEVWREAYEDAQRLKEEHPRAQGRPRNDDENAKELAKAQNLAKEIKSAAYALGKAPENLTQKQREKLNLIAATNDKLFRAYRMKEKLRLIFQVKDVQLAEEELEDFLSWASRCRIPAMVNLGKKIRRHKEHILNSIRFGMSNARVESTNNKIKLIIRKAYGFRNVENMLDLVYLVCSNLIIPLPNRKPGVVQAL